MVNESGDGDQAAIPRQGQEVAGSGAPTAEDVAMSRPNKPPKYHFSETDDYIIMMLVEANARRPFEQPHGQVLKEWKVIAEALVKQDEFQKKDASGKSCQARIESGRRGILKRSLTGI